MMTKDDTKALVRFLNLCVLAFIVLLLAQCGADIREFLKIG